MLQYIFLSRVISCVLISIRNADRHICSMWKTIVYTKSVQYPQTMENPIAENKRKRITLARLRSDNVDLSKCSSTDVYMYTEGVFVTIHSSRWIRMINNFICSSRFGERSVAIRSSAGRSKAEVLRVANINFDCSWLCNRRVHVSQIHSAETN